MTKPPKVERFIEAGLMKAENPDQIETILDVELTELGEEFARLLMLILEHENKADWWSMELMR